MFAMALGTYGALNHTFGQGVALNNMGGVHLGQKAYEEARNQFVLAASFFRSANALSWEAQAFENLAAAEAGMGNTKSAIESYARALEIWQKQDQFDRQALILNRIASLHVNLGDSRRALELHGRALALAQKADNIAVAAASHSSLGRLYFEARNFNAARTEFQAALISYEELGDKRGQAQVLLSLARLDIASGQELAALAAKLFREAGDKAGEQAASALLPSDPVPSRPAQKDKSA
jgi:tetratricopeptide (TPR) repeat protein